MQLVLSPESVCGGRCWFNRQALTAGVEHQSTPPLKVTTVLRRLPVGTTTFRYWLSDKQNPVRALVALQGLGRQRPQRIERGQSEALRPPNLQPSMCEEYLARAGSEEDRVGGWDLDHLSLSKLGINRHRTHQRAAELELVCLRLRNCEARRNTPANTSSWFHRAPASSSCW